MKYIQKKPSPTCIIGYSKKPDATYHKFRKTKSYISVKKALIEEQGYICCYCGRRLKFDSTQVEHLYAKGTPHYAEMQLDYENNLLACCDGGKAERAKKLISKDELFCECVKGERILPINPLNQVCEKKFLYNEHGEVLGIGSDAEVTIKLLNLNSPIIKNLRKAAIDMYSIFPPTSWSDEVNRLDLFVNKKLEEFCFVLKSYIINFKLNV